MPIMNSTKTVQDVADYVKRQFGDESGVQLTDNDLLRWVNDGQMEIVAKNKILQGKASTQLIAGQKDYSFSTENIIDIDSIHVNGVPVRYMQFPDVEQYIFGQDPSGQQTGQPSIYYSYAGQITFWPVPAEEGTITIFYVREPKAVTSSADVLDIPDRYYTTLIEYVLAKSYQMDEDYSAYTNSMNVFSANLDNMSEEESNINNLAYPSITTLEY